MSPLSFAIFRAFWILSTRSFGSLDLQEIYSSFMDSSTPVEDEVFITAVDIP